MIEETAVVVAAAGDEFAWVQTQRKSTCGGCSANKGCGTAVLSRVLGQRVARMKAINSVGAKPGDSVVVGLQEGALLHVSLAVYLLPLVSLLGFAVLGQAFSVQLGIEAGELPALLFAAVGLVAGGLWVRRYSRRISADARYQPVILRLSPGVSAAATTARAGGANHLG